MTDCGTCVPPGPSKKAIGRPSCSSDRAGKRARMASTSKAVIVVLGRSGAPDPSRSRLEARSIVAVATIELGIMARDDCPTAARSPSLYRRVGPSPRAIPRIATWRGFLLAHARLERLLDEDLRAEHDLSLAEYDALLQLAEAPGRRLRMHQLADRVLLSRSGVTRLIDRLVRDGSVERDPCLSDARGAEAVLTQAGPGAAADRVRRPTSGASPTTSSTRSRRATSTSSSGRCATSSPRSSPTRWRTGGPRG